MENDLISPNPIGVYVQGPLRIQKIYTALLEHISYLGIQDLINPLICDS